MRTEGFKRSLAIAALIFCGAQAAAQERQITLGAAPELAESGLLKHMLPRFSLKNSIRVAVALPDAEGVDMLLIPRPPEGGGKAAFSGGGTTYVLIEAEASAAERAEYRAKFADWLLSDTGLNTVLAFQPTAGEAYTAPVVEAVVAEATVFEGDAEEGARLSLTLCGRCHVIGEINRMDGLGSTPSFAVLRTFGDWEERFMAFYALKPHPAFTQIADITEPFDATRPSPIAPVEMTLEDLDAILAFVSAIAPADLGAPIQHQ